MSLRADRCGNRIQGMIDTLRLLHFIRNDNAEPSNGSDVDHRHQRPQAQPWVGGIKSTHILILSRLIDGSYFLQFYKKLLIFFPFYDILKMLYNLNS